MSLLGGFDTVIQLHESCLNRIVRTLHSQGQIVHRQTWFYEGQRLDMVLSLPQVTLQHDAGGDSRWGRAAIRATAFLHGRPLADAERVGQAAVVDLTGYARFALSTGNPGRLRDWTRACVQGDPDRPPQVTLRTSAPDPDFLRRAILHWVCSVRGWWWLLPDATFADQEAGSAAVAVVESPSLRALALALNMGDRLKGASSAITVPAVDRDWAVALAEELVVSQITGILDRDYPLPTRLNRRCTMRTFWGACWNWAVTRLVSRSVELAGGYIKVTGRIQVRNSGFLVPDLWADFTIELSLAMDAGGTFLTEVHSTEVDITDPFWSFIDTLAGNQLAGSIETAIQSSLGNFGSSGLANLWDDQLVRELVTRGAPQLSGIGVKTTGLTLRSDALVLHGDLTGIDVAGGPVAAFVVQGRDDPRVKVFNAGQSWARGDTIVEYRWGFGDGSSVVRSGDQRRFVEEHSYGSLRGWLSREGTLIVSLTVKDSRGRRSTARRAISFPVARRDNLLLFSST